MENAKKNEVKVLTTNDIRKHAQNWTLAGDVGLLAHLEKFSENIYNRTQETQKCFNELVDNYEELYTKIGNVTNEFLALQNCQFVENRVYDEETPTEEKPEVKPTPDAAEQEKLLLIQYKQAVEVGVKLLDTHFQEVHLPPNSDSDDEDEESTGNSLLWKPKNPYADKKFPLLIGSKEWWADDNVGLGDYEENLDTEKIVSDESDMESIPEVEKKIESPSSSSFEDEKIIPSKPTFLESSSEDLFGLNKNDTFQNEPSDFFGKENNSLLEEPPLFSPSFEKESYIKPENLDSSVSENHISHENDNVTSNNTINKQPYKVSNAFTQELAAKLASVTGSSENVTSKVKENIPAEKPVEKKPISNESLFDETDDSSDLFSGNMKTKSVNNKSLFFDGENDDKLFSGSNDLFFDSGSLFENSTLKNSQSQFTDTTKKKNTAEYNKVPDQKAPSLPKKPLSNSLFDDIDDEDTLFASGQNVKSPIESLPSVSNTSNNVQSAVSTDLETSSEGLFNSINNDFLNELSDSKKEKAVDSKFSDNSRTKNDKQILEDTSEQKVAVSGESQMFTPEPHTKTNLFDDASNFIPPQKPKDKKFNFLDPEDDSDDLFSSSLTEDSLFHTDKKINSSLPKVVASVNDDDASLFVDKPKQQDSVSISSSRSSLFEDVSAPKSRLASVFDKDKNNRVEDDLFNDSLFGENNPEKADADLFSTKPTIRNKEKNKNSLFDDFDDSDDLFGASKNEDIFKEQSLFEKPKDIQVEKSKSVFGEKEKEKKEEVQESKSVSNKKTTSTSLFESDLGDDDLFTTSNLHSKQTEVLFDETTKNTTEASQEKLTKVQVPSKTMPEVTKPDIFENVRVKSSTENKVYDDLDDTELFGNKSASDTGKPKPPSSLEIKKEDVDSNVLQKTKSVGKLNIPDNLKTKFESMAKNISTGQVKPKEEKKIEDLNESFLPPSDLLKCPSKDRVKIPGKRRPQSRRARQEALRNSGANFLMNLENEVVEDPKPNKANSCVDLTQKEFEPVKTASEPLFPSPVLSNPLSPSTDEEDYFNVPELDTNFEKEDQSIFKSSLFQSSSKSIVDDSPLFDSTPVVNTLSPKKDQLESNKEDSEEDSLFGFVKPKAKPKPVSIFDDDDEENLFNADIPVKSKKEVENSTKQSSLLFQSSQNKFISDGEKLKKPLFDSEIDDEEDLFGGSLSKPTVGNVSSKPTATEKVEKNNDKPSQSKENENMSFVDPLGLMSKND